ncbi:hypothetical protein SprV_0100497000 [Sparganum proliferum]
MDDERLPKRLFYGDVSTGSRRQGGQIRRYKDTLKSSLKRLQINPSSCEGITHNRPTWRRTIKTGTAFYEANRIAAAIVERKVRKSQLRLLRNTDAQPPPTCPRCQRTFRARIGLIGHLWINCTSRTAPTVVPSPASSSSSPPLTNYVRSSEPPFPSSSSSSSSPSSPLHLLLLLLLLLLLILLHLFLHPLLLLLLFLLFLLLYYYLRLQSSNLRLIDTLTLRDRSYATRNSSMVIPPPLCTTSKRPLSFASKSAFL